MGSSWEPDEFENMNNLKSHFAIIYSVDVQEICPVSDNLILLSDSDFLIPKPVPDKQVLRGTWEAAMDW